MQLSDIDVSDDALLWWWWPVCVCNAMCNILLMCNAM